MFGKCLVKSDSNISNEVLAVVEQYGAMVYNKIMKRSSSVTSFQAAFSRLLDSLDVRYRRKNASLQPGETVEVAWRNTGMYLRKAMNQHDREASARVSSRPSR